MAWFLLFLTATSAGAGLIACVASKDPAASALRMASACVWGLASWWLYFASGLFG